MQYAAVVRKEEDLLLVPHAGMVTAPYCQRQRQLAMWDAPMLNFTSVEKQEYAARWCQLEVLLVSLGCKCTIVVGDPLQMKGLDPREAHRLFCVYPAN